MLVRLLFLYFLLFPLALFANDGDSCSLNFAKIYGPDARELRYESFFSIPRRSTTETAELNREMLRRLNSEAPDLTSRRKPSFSERELQDFYRKLRENPQVSESLCGAYKGSEKGIGFCFGRAMAAHLMAIESGLNKSSIRKIWAVGSLESGGTSWRYHVATMVQVEGKGWYVVDPIMGQALSAEQWYARMKAYDHEGTMRIFATDASRFGPGSATKYNKSALADEFYHGFFGDLIDQLHRERTGRPGPWSNNANDKTLRNILIGAGITVPPGAGALLNHYLGDKE